MQQARLQESELRSENIRIVFVEIYAYGKDIRV